MSLVAHFSVIFPYYFTPHTAYRTPLTAHRIPHYSYFILFAGLVLIAVTS